MGVGVNDLTFNQLSTVLNSMAEQATGAAQITPTNTYEFVSLGITTLKTGYDKVLNAISQVGNDTWFSIRPYYAKFNGLEKSASQFGNHVRKLQLSDKDWEDESKFDLIDGQSIDHYKVNKPKCLQTNFYGQNIYKRYTTILIDQLDAAFRNPDEFGRFLTMQMQNNSDIIAQAHEVTARGTLANAIGGKYLGDNGNVYHLVTIYNSVAGTSLDSQTVRQPQNFVPFFKWAISFIKSISDLMTERSSKYQINITGNVINRHTPYQLQHMYLLNQDMNEIETSILSDTFHDDYLKIIDFETINFWQSIEDGERGNLNVAPGYIDSTGAAVNGVATSIENIFGVLFDDECIGYTTINQRTISTPVNADGCYSNMFFHFTDRFYNDLTEKMAVFLLD